MHIACNPQSHNWQRKIVVFLLFTALLWPPRTHVASAQGGPTIDAGGAGAIAGEMTTPGGEVNLSVQSARNGLAAQDYAAILDAAWTRYARARAFRSQELQHFGPRCLPGQPR